MTYMSAAAGLLRYLSAGLLRDIWGVALGTRSASRAIPPRKTTLEQFLAPIDFAHGVSPPRTERWPNKADGPILQ